MNPPPRILILEDNPNDCQLLQETLRSEGLSFEFIHARNHEEFQSALEKYQFDLVISDFTLPSYSGTAALILSKRLQPETPFIFVSGTIGEERAVESLKLGATDYILKDRLGRLNEAVRRALREAEERRNSERGAIRSKQLEAQLHQSQKMEAIGQLAGGIAHDFNNLLLVIHGNAELVLRAEKQLTGQGREHLKHITSAAERGANLIRQLLAFSRKQTVRFQPFNLNQVISNLAKMVHRIVGEDISLQCQFEDDLPSVFADVGLIEQVLMNLIVNARDAMPRGGVILISTRALKIDDSHAVNHPYGRAGGFVCIEISDNGEGIRPEHLPRIFEPFFTTKEVGKGTGLGLATAYGIIQQHDGWIEVSSRPGAGATFKIFLPANVSGTEEKNVPTSRPVSHGNREKILLVEDDADVRNFLSHVLQETGYRIQEASTGAEALKIWNEDQEKSQLLLTDIVMPGGMSGKELAERLQAEQPELKVLFMSGYNPDITGKIQAQGQFLQKPCSIESLTYAIRRCLDVTAKSNN